MPRTANTARPSPPLAPAAAPPAHRIAEDGYRLAVCLLGDARAAEALLVQVVGSVRAHRLRRPTPALRAVVLRWVIAGARAARGRGMMPAPRPRGAAFPELQALPAGEREVLALALACDLDVGEAARVLRADPAHVLGLRRSACRGVAAFGRASGDPGAADARCDLPA